MKVPRLRVRIPDTAETFRRFHHLRIESSGKVHSRNCECRWSDSIHNRSGNKLRGRRLWRRNSESVRRSRRRCNSPIRNTPGKVSYPNRRDFPSSTLRRNRSDKRDFPRRNHTTIHPNRQCGQIRRRRNTLRNVHRKKDFPGRIHSRHPRSGPPHNHFHRRGSIHRNRNTVSGVPPGIPGKGEWFHGQS